MTAYFEEELVPDLPLAQDTTAQRFVAFNAKHPEIMEAIHAEATDRVRRGALRISMKGIFESLRGRFPHLNNSYTSYYTDALIDRDPFFQHYFERRRRADHPMRLVNR